MEDGIEEEKFCREKKKGKKKERKKRKEHWKIYSTSFYYCLEEIMAKARIVISLERKGMLKCPRLG